MVCLQGAWRGFRGTASILTARGRYVQLAVARESAAADREYAATMSGRVLRRGSGERRYRKTERYAAKQPQ
jgi:hypothetical protein